MEWTEPLILSIFGGLFKDYRNWKSYGSVHSISYFKVLRNQEFIQTFIVVFYAQINL